MIARNSNSPRPPSTMLVQTMIIGPQTVRKSRLLLLLLLKTLYVPQRAFQHTITICNLK